MIKSYLSERKQRIKIGQIHSTWESIVKGVPQGSILGPILFNVFVNDIYKCIKDCNIYNYADDNTISKKNRNKERLIGELEIKTKECINWFEVNHMQANPEKFQAICLEPKVKRCNDTNEEQSSLCINDTKITFQECVILLGIKIDDKLSFHKHVTDLCKKAARQLNVLCRMNHLLDKKTKMVIYRTYILSNFNYCPLVWHFCGASNASKMEKIPKKSFKFCFQKFQWCWRLCIRDSIIRGTAERSWTLNSDYKQIEISGKTGIHVFK